MWKTILMLMLAQAVLAGCSLRGLLPLEVPEGGNLLRCTQAEIQAAGSMIQAGGRADTCQCIGMGPGFQGEVTIELPGCKATIRGLTQ